MITSPIEKFCLVAQDNKNFPWVVYIRDNIFDTE